MEDESTVWVTIHANLSRSPLIYVGCSVKNINYNIDSLKNIQFGLCSLLLTAYPGLGITPEPTGGKALFLLLHCRSSRVGNSMPRTKQEHVVDIPEGEKVDSYSYSLPFGVIFPLLARQTSVEHVFMIHSPLTFGATVYRIVESEKIEKMWSRLNGS